MPLERPVPEPKTPPFPGTSPIEPPFPGDPDTEWLPDPLEPIRVPEGPAPERELEPV